jgi:SH3-like domain-containing protein
MKTNGWLILGLMMASSVLAQNNTNTLPPIPAPAVAPTAEVAPAPAVTNAPVKHKKHVAVAPKRAAIDEPTVTLAPGAAQVSVNDLNVRGQAGLKGEVVAHLKKGDVVAVMSQLNLDKHATGEPAQWAKISLPASNHVWVNTKYIDAATKTVSAKKLNLRAGPGENFSVLGVVEQGTAVNVINTKGAWSEIEPPASAYAFVAAMYLKQEALGNLAANPPASAETTPAGNPAPAPAPAPTPTSVPEAAPVVTTPPATPETTAPAAANPAPVTPVVETAPVDTNPPPPRVVTHEGVVGPVGSIIAPTPYVLYDLSTRQNINFLYTTSTNLDIGRYSGMLIDVTGEESVAERWKDTPLLTIQRIVVLNTNAIPKVYFPTPRQRG